MQNLQPLNCEVTRRIFPGRYAHFVREEEGQGGREGRRRDARAASGSLKCAPERWIDCVVEEEMRM